MNNETITVNGREYTLHHTSAIISVIDLMHRYRDVEKFLSYCKECHRYKTCWACPPFDFDADNYLTAYPVAHIISTKINLDKEIINTHQGSDQCTKISYEVIGEVRNVLDERLLKLEKQYPESRAYFAGTCRICPLEKCTKTTGEPCITPEMIRPSLEAFGFDVSRISAELLNIEMKWSYDGVLPEYFTLVSGLFSTKEAIDFFIP